MVVILEPVTLVTMTCGECGIVFAVPEDWAKQKLKDGSAWTCPNDHRRAFAATAYIAERPGFATTGATPHIEE